MRSLNWCKDGLGWLALMYFPLLHAQLPMTKENVVEARLKEHFPDLKIDEVHVSPIDGLYQVSAEGAILYVSHDGRFAFSGDIIDLQKDRQNLTEEARKKARLKLLNKIDKEDMIIFAPPQPKYTVTVFTDIDCSYCRKLQDEMPEINKRGIAVQYLAFPRAGLNSETGDKMAKIWCAKDRQQALDQAKQGKATESTTCGNEAIKKSFQLGLMLGVTGTPTLLFEDGSLIPGYLSPDKLLEVIKQIKEKR